MFGSGARRCTCPRACTRSRTICTGKRWACLAVGTCIDAVHTRAFRYSLRGPAFHGVLMCKRKYQHSIRRTAQDAVARTSQL